MFSFLIFYPNSLYSMKLHSLNAAAFLLMLLCLTDVWAQTSTFERQRIYSSQINKAAISTKVYQFPLESGVYRIEFSGNTRSGNRAMQQIPNSEAVKSVMANSADSYQHWIFTQNGNNTYTISNFESGRCLSHDAATGKLQTTSCQGNDDQQWLLRGSAGNFSLQNKATQQFVSLRIASFDNSAERQIRTDNGTVRRAAQRLLFAMVESGENTKCLIEKQPCDVPLKSKTLRQEGNIAVLRPNISLFLTDNMALGKQNKPLFEKIQRRKMYEEEPIDINPFNNGLQNPASDEEREALQLRLNTLREAIDNSSGDIRYYLNTKGLLGDSYGSAISIQAITRPALAALNAELDQIAPLIAVPTLCKEQIAIVTQSSRTICTILEDTTKTFCNMFYYSSYGTRALRFSAVTSSGSSLNNVQFYVMNNRQFNQNVQFVCEYYICQANTLSFASELVDSDAIFGTNEYYHVFAVQQRNGTNNIIGYAKVPPVIELLTVRVD